MVATKKTTIVMAHAPTAPAQTGHQWQPAMKKNQLQPATPAHVYVPAAQPTDVPPTITAAVAAPFYAT